jgi:hypothetical protein
MNEETPLTEEEARHLRALKLFYEAQGRHDLVKNLDEASPAVQRLAITMYHQWLEYPESFGTAWRWTVKFLPLIRAYAWLKEKLSKVFSRD